MAEMRFVPRNPQKYMGNVLKITARSKWELLYMNALDNSNMVVKWISEPKTLNIKYFSPLDKKPHQYWPDFLVQYVDGSIEILEIKPMKESSLEAAKSTYDKLMFAKNIAKWQAADRFAKAIGAKFRVITEQQLFGRKSTSAPRRAKKTTGTRR
jgi:hypothetical protein